MSDIVPIGASMPGRPDRMGAVSYINRYEDLRAGQYWQAKDDVPALTKAEKRKRGVYLPHDHPDYIGDGMGFDVNKIGDEEYLVDVPVRDACPAGRIHLVRSLKLVDGGIHAVVLQGHPGEKTSSRTYLIDEFLHFFEFVEMDEAERIREQEIAALRDEITVLQQDMIAGPPSETPIALIGHQAKLPPKPTLSTMIANIEHIESLQAKAEQAVAIAERQSQWIMTHTQKIAERTQALVPFFQEKANAALASTESVMRYATELQKGVQSLNLYTGEGVEVRQLVEGKSAPSTEKLTIYRDRLYMDEEYVINLDGEPVQNGADHEDFDDFVEALKTDGKLRDRVLPYPRMVVLMRYRRTGREYFSGNTIADALANAEYNKPNRKTFLLIRDGDNLWQVWSELTTQEIPALYPTKSMGDAPFTGVRGEAITIDDLTFAESKGKFDDLNRVYKNLLILMWGLNDRLQLFGDFYNPSDWSGNGFIDESFQSRYFTFWDPLRDNLTIGRGLPRFVKWVQEKNSWLRSGSRVIVMRRALQGESALGKNEMDRIQPEAIRSIHGVAYEHIVRKTKKGHVVPVSASRTIYPRDIRPSYTLTQSHNVALDEECGGYSNHGSLLWLCLDLVESWEIDHYLESRIDRPDYMEHYAVLLSAREALREDEIIVGPVIDKLVAAFEDNGAMPKDGAAPRDIARQVIRQWRTAQRGLMVPAIGTEGHSEVYKTLLSNMWTLSGHNHPVEAAESLAQEEGRKPLRLVMTGKERFALYATSVGDEIESRLFEHAWVTRLSCRRKAGKLVVTSRMVMLMPKAVTDEEVLHRWKEEDEWNGRDLPGHINHSRYRSDRKADYDYQTIRKGFDLVEGSDLTNFMTPPEHLSMTLVRLHAIRKSIQAKRRYVHDLEYVQPFAIVRSMSLERHLVEGFASRYESSQVEEDYLVLVLQDNAYRMVNRTLVKDDDRRRLVDSYISTYEHKKVNEEKFLLNAGKAPTVAAISLSDFAGMGDDPYRRERMWKNIDLDPNWAENLRTFTEQRDGSKPRGMDLISPTLDEVLIWMKPETPAMLNEICRLGGWEAKPFVPGKGV